MNGQPSARYRRAGDQVTHLALSATFGLKSSSLAALPCPNPFSPLFPQPSGRVWASSTPATNEWKLLKFFINKKYLIFRWFASQFLKKFGLKKIQRSSFIDSRGFFWDDPSVRDWIRTFRVWFRVMNGHLRSTGATSEWMSPSSTRFLFLSFCWPQSSTGNEWNIFFKKFHSFGWNV